jgi:P27 family predicted phage terminase small subunit
MSARPKPTALKVVQGTAVKSRVRDDEPEYRNAEIGTPPDGLTVEGLKAWERIAPQLLEAGVLKSADVDALRQLCDSLGTYEEAHRTIAKTGYFTKAANGLVMLSPAVYLRNQAAKDSQKLLIEFGMTPAARTRIGATKQKKRGDDWDAF